MLRHYFKIAFRNLLKYKTQNLRALLLSSLFLLGGEYGKQHDKIRVKPLKPNKI